jgi:hypothetical protein
LSEEQLLQISTAAILCEHAFGGKARDVEWAIDEQNRLYLLQARAVTMSTLSSLSDCPLSKNSSTTFGHLLIEREFDSALSTGSEWNTTANVAEMIPGAMSPLSISTFARAVELGMQDMIHQCGNAWPRLLPNSPHFLTLSANHAFINLSSKFKISLLNLNIDNCIWIWIYIYNCNVFIIVNISYWCNRFKIESGK